MCNTTIIKNNAKNVDKENVIVPEFEIESSEIEEEARKLKAIQTEIGRKMTYKPVSNTKTFTFLTPEERAEADSKSIYIGNVDYNVTEEELKRHFNGCGSVHRVTIPSDKYSGSRKGFAYLEFADKEGVKNGLKMTGTLLKGRQINVVEKRTNIRGVTTKSQAPIRRGGSGRGGYGGVVVKYVYVGGYGARGAKGARNRPGFAPY